MELTGSEVLVYVSHPRDVLRVIEKTERFAEVEIAHDIKGCEAVTTLPYQIYNLGLHLWYVSFIFSTSKST